MIKIITSGAVINFITIVAGSLFGLLINRGISKRICDALMCAMGMSVLYIGVSGIIKENVNALIIVISMAIGAAVGELLDLDKWVNRLADNISSHFKPREYGASPSQGMVTATMIFCIGAMAIVGSIESGISGNNATLYSKSMIDGITSVVLASTLGYGVMFSAVPVLALEGAITLAARFVEPYLTEHIITHVSVVGSLLIIVISLNMLKLTKIKVMNLMPAVILPLVLCLFM